MIEKIEDGKLQPIGNRLVVLKIFKGEEVSCSGIVTSTGDKKIMKTTDTARVISVSEAVKVAGFDEGDLILFNRYKGTDFPISDLEMHTVLELDDVIGKIVESEETK